jgi:hypothetical protein
MGISRSADGVCVRCQRRPKGSLLALPASDPNRSFTLNHREQEECLRGSTLIEEVRFAGDSPVEGDGFEPSVPRQKDNAFSRLPRPIRQFSFREQNRFLRDSPIQPGLHQPRWALAQLAHKRRRSFSGHRGAGQILCAAPIITTGAVVGITPLLEPAVQWNNLTCASTISLSATKPCSGWAWCRCKQRKGLWYSFFREEDSNDTGWHG